MSGEERSFEEVLDAVVEADPRYAREAYLFVQLALDHYRETHGGGERRHLTGPEVLTGVRDLALSQYGPFARQVLNHWGLDRGEDVGEVVYNLIEAGVMSRTEEDAKEDFAGVMEFDEAMEDEHSW